MAALKRLRLIKAVANVGGGTHYPPDIRDYFEKLQRLGVTATRRGEAREFDSAFIEDFERRHKLGRFREVGGLKGQQGTTKANDSPT